MSKKGGFFLLLCTLLLNSFKDLPNFCMTVEDNRSHWLSKIGFLKKILILDYRGSSVQKGVLFTLDFTPKGL